MRSQARPRAGSSVVTRRAALLPPAPLRGGGRHGLGWPWLNHSGALGTGAGPRLQSTQTSPPPRALFGPCGYDVEARNEMRESRLPPLHVKPLSWHAVPHMQPSSDHMIACGGSGQSPPSLAPHAAQL